MLRLFSPGRWVGWLRKRTEVLQWKGGLLTTISNVHDFISKKFLEDQKPKEETNVTLASW